MKYRILERNGQFKIKIKSSWYRGWREIGTNEGYLFLPKIFESYDQAKEGAIKFIGHKKKEKEPWKIVGSL